uniref:Uncharacterized protein n=1 Tax=Caenorhabditis tropicalis TaxID=1561998 RepID=A0A1I7T0I4_9PELO
MTSFCVSSNVFELSSSAEQRGLLVAIAAATFVILKMTKEERKKEKEKKSFFEKRFFEINSRFFCRKRTDSARSLADGIVEKVQNMRDLIGFR